MPSHDAKLSIKIDGYINYTDYIHEYIDNMLIPLYLQEELIYNYLFNNNRTYVKEEKGYIYKYYGLYNSNLVVMMDTSKSAYYQKPYEEVIDGVKFTYQDSNRILVYSDGKFYSLQEAFDIGL